LIKIETQEINANYKQKVHFIITQLCLGLKDLRNEKRIFAQETQTFNYIEGETKQVHQI
jgi:hypothetical protein